MKTNWGKVITLGIVALAIVAWLVWSKTSHEPATVLVPEPVKVPSALESNPPVVAQNLPKPMRDRAFKERMSEFTDEEKAELTNLFITKLKPAAEKWALIYSNRIPFNLGDLTMDKFVERIGTRIPKYTFVMGDITLQIEDYFGDPKVNYLASRQALTARTTMPTLTGAPDLSMPVTQQQVMQMVEADSGVQFPPNLVTLTPTGESGSLMGGVDVEVGKEVNNPIYREFGGTNYSFVFGSNGNLAFYLRSEIANTIPTAPKSIK